MASDVEKQGESDGHDANEIKQKENVKTTQKIEKGNYMFAYNTTVV